jgi:hypothetical protein
MMIFANRVTNDFITTTLVPQLESTVSTRLLDALTEIPF